MTERWDIYGSPAFEADLTKGSGPAWDALRTLIQEIAEAGGDAIGLTAGYPWPNTVRYAVIEDDAQVFGALEWLVEHEEHRIARILALDWLPDVGA